MSKDVRHIGPTPMPRGGRARQTIHPRLRVACLSLGCVVLVSMAVHLTSCRRFLWGSGSQPAPMAGIRKAVAVRQIKGTPSGPKTAAGLTQFFIQRLRELGQPATVWQGYSWDGYHIECVLNWPEGTSCEGRQTLRATAVCRMNLGPKSRQIRRSAARDVCTGDSDTGDSDAIDGLQVVAKAALQAVAKPVADAVDAQYTEAR